MLDRNSQSDHQLLANLLAEVLRPGAKRVLVYGVRVLGPLLASAFPFVRVTETSLLAREQARHEWPTLHYADEVSLPFSDVGSYDLAVIAAPQSRALARRWLAEAREGLREGGGLYLAGENDLGIRSLIDDAGALFGGAQTKLIKRRSRVAFARKQPVSPLPAWLDEPGIAPGTFASFDVLLPDVSLTCETLPGVFAYDRLDAGTMMILKHSGDVRGARVLDLGCGCGIIGLVLAHRGACQIDMLDENVYAVAATERNITRFQLDNARVVAANTRAPQFRGPYDLIVTNPPFHRGKGIDYTATHGFIRAAGELLAPGGRFVLVANSFLRYDDLLRKQFATIERLAGDKQFTVWQARYGATP